MSTSASETTASVRSESGPVGVEGLLPPQIAEAAERLGAAKCRMDLRSTLMLAVLAGAFIAMGAIFSTTALAGAGALPYGVGRVLGGLAFCLGLILVIVAGAELFTGNNLLVMAYVSKRLSTYDLLRNWTVVYLGNLIGSLVTAGVMFLTGQYAMGDGVVGHTSLAIASSKCELSVIEAVTRGIYCNALVCLAVWLCLSCRTTTDKILAILFPITAFVAAGFEHSVANMYFISIGLLILNGAPPEFWEIAGTDSSAFGSLTWSNFLFTNLLPVTVGNIIGGSVFVGLVYWVIYRAPRHLHGRSDA